MLFDSLRDEMGGPNEVTPMGIAHNSLFTAKEKLEMLNQLKADAAAAGEEGQQLGFTAEEIEQAIAEVHQGVQDGNGSQSAFKGGDF